MQNQIQQESSQNIFSLTVFQKKRSYSRIKHIKKVKKICLYASAIYKKRKMIKKQSKTQKKDPKSIDSSKQNTKTLKSGRPRNSIIEMDHLKISKSYNQVYYHFAKFLLCLRFMKAPQSQNIQLSLKNEESGYLSYIENVLTMPIDYIFPQVYQVSSPEFLMHSNSLHFLFLAQKEYSGKVTYSSQQVKYMLFALLKVRKLLTVELHTYICRYWKDIIYLINHQNDDINSKHSKAMNTHYKKVRPTDQNCQIEEEQMQLTEREEIQNQLKEDESVAAYQIACYLYFCCTRLDLTIYSSQ